MTVQPEISGFRCLPRAKLCFAYSVRFTPFQPIHVGGGTPVQLIFCKSSKNIHPEFQLSWLKVILWCICELIVMLYWWDKTTLSFRSLSCVISSGEISFMNTGQIFIVKTMTQYLIKSIPVTKSSRGGGAPEYVLDVIRIVQSWSCFYCPTSEACWR